MFFNNKFTIQKNLLKDTLNFRIKLPITKLNTNLNNLKRNYQIYINLLYFLNFYHYFSFFSFNLFNLIKKYNIFLILNKKSLTNYNSFFLFFFLFKINNFKYFLKYNKSFFINNTKKKLFFFTFFYKKYLLKLQLIQTLNTLFEDFINVALYKIKTTRLNTKILFFTLVLKNTIYNKFFIFNQQIFLYKILKIIFKLTFKNLQIISNKNYFFYTIFINYYNYKINLNNIENFKLIFLVNLYRNRIIKYFLLLYKNKFKIFYKNIFEDISKIRIRKKYLLN